MVASGDDPRRLIIIILCHIPLLFAQARLDKLRLKKNGIERRDPLSDGGLVSASWIWTSSGTTGNVAFLKEFSSAAGKAARSASISMTAVNRFTLWVNGQPIGASGDGLDDWKSATVFSAQLNVSTNTFSVLAVNNANSALPAPGFLAAIQVKYDDGTVDTVLSDSSWAVSAIIPSDFPTPSDTSHFSAASVAAPFGSGPWRSSVTVASADPDALSLSGQTWIWSTSTAASIAPVGTVGFRKTVLTLSSKVAQTATVLITVDNSYALYLNGKYVGKPPIANFPYAQQFTMFGLSPASNIFTVIAENQEGPAGVIAAIRIQYSNGSSDVVGTDASWLSGNLTSVPSFLSTADSTLFPTFTIGTMGDAPWHQLAGISNALDAANVPSGPFTGGSVLQASPSGGGVDVGSSATPTTGGAGHVSSTGGANGSSAGPISSTTTRPGSTSASSSPSGMGGASKAGSSSGPSATGPTSTRSSISSAHGVPVGLIVGPAVGGLALLIGGLVLFCWHRRRGARRHSQSPSNHPFFPINDGSQTAVSTAGSRTSGASGRQAELAPVIFSSLRPPMMQAGFPQPYPQLLLGGPQLQGFIPPTKIERENMALQNMVLGAGSGSVSVGINPVVPSSADAAGPSREASRPGPSDATLDPDTETLPPPSYHAEVPE
ncbi:hypothetical protein DFH09DRAFT_421905 [Mycena vulgaris]|nr:hypothetical protein DFH09DRAFT_421905 [Mycena vulgaris]